MHAPVLGVASAEEADQQRKQVPSKNNGWIPLKRQAGARRLQKMVKVSVLVPENGAGSVIRRRTQDGSCNGGVADEHGCR